MPSFYYAKKSLSNVQIVCKKANMNTLNISIPFLSRNNASHKSNAMPVFDVVWLVLYAFKCKYVPQMFLRSHSPKV